MLQVTFSYKQVSKWVKRIGIAVTVLLLLITIYKWYDYSTDNEFKQRVAVCQKSSGSHEEFNDCIKFPTKDHQTKQASALLYTYISIFTALVIFGTLWLYKFFFLTKRPE